ncbi:MAG: adenine deaminase [Halobacteriales archaeon]
MASEVDLLVDGTLVNVLTGNLEDRAIAIDDGEIVALADRPARTTLEADYITPGLINAHMHVESTMVTLPQYARAVVPQGVTGVVADPHEIGNVLGEEGVRALLEDATRTPLKARFTVPSSVPASSLQDAGATIGPETVARLLDEPTVVGLAEVMEIGPLVAGEASVHAKIEATRERGLTVDGHLSGITGDDLQEAARYLDTDHESRELDAAREKVDAGLHLQLREGSSSKNLDALMPLLDAVDSRRLSVCTDNFYIYDLVEHGGIDAIIKRLLAAGVDPVEAVQLATINPAERYDLPFGRVKPGAPADLVILDDLESWSVEHVIIDGEIDPTAGVIDSPDIALAGDTVHFEPVTAADMAHPAAHTGKHTIRVIDHTGGITREMTGTVSASDGWLMPNYDTDILPAAVIERHGKGAGIGTGFVHGFDMERGAIASTVAHDAHNLVVVGADHAAMARLANRVRELGGAVAAYDPAADDEADGAVTALELPVAGLMANDPVETVNDRFEAVQATVRELGVPLDGGIMELDNLSLEVIPELRLTNNGLVDVRVMDYVDVVIE